MDNMPTSSPMALPDPVRTVGKHRKMILQFMLGAAVVSALVVFVMPKTYTATVTILPPQSNASQIGNQLSMLAGLAGLGGLATGAKKNSELYVSMLKSRTLVDLMIERFDLKKVYGEDLMTDARDALDDATRVQASKEGMIRIEVDDRDPVRAARMADAYVEELHKLTQTLSVTDASRRRRFFEQQLKSTQAQLASAELAFKQMQEGTGMLQLDGQAQISIGAIAQLKARIAAKEVEIGAIQSFATDRYSELQLSRSELSALKSQLSKLEKQDTESNSLLQPGGNLPAAGLEYVRRLRDVRYQEAMYEMLAKQYELARIEEARDHTLIEALDKAEVPEKKSSPKRLLTIILSTLLAGAAGVLAALYREARTSGR